MRAVSNKAMAMREIGSVVKIRGSEDEWIITAYHEPKYESNHASYYYWVEKYPEGGDKSLVRPERIETIINRDRQSEESKQMNLLPVGTVVTLKESEQIITILGVAPNLVNEEYVYIGVKYPQGCSSYSRFRASRIDHVVEVDEKRSVRPSVLPVGSIVRCKNGEEMIICGNYEKSVEGVLCEYSACTYPEGLFSDYGNLKGIDNEFITTVVKTGYYDKKWTEYLNRKSETVSVELKTETPETLKKGVVAIVAGIVMLIILFLLVVSKSLDFNGGDTRLLMYLVGVMPIGSLGWR